MTAALPYEVTQVVEATDTQPETRTVIAAFREAAVADWFTDHLEPAPGIHFETPGLGPDLAPGAIPDPGQRTP